MLRILVAKVENLKAQVVQKKPNIIPGADELLWYKSHVVNNKDTVEVVVFNPHETDSSMGQDWRERPLLLLVHQKSHEVLNL